MAEQTNSFVPSGVDAGTWMGFETRIRHRRFAALAESFEQAVRDGDCHAAQAALDEARELQPESSFVQAADVRLAMLEPPAEPLAAAGYMWSRVFGAVALLLVGVSLLIGLDWLRTTPPVPLAPPTASLPVLGPLNIAPTDELVIVRPNPPRAVPGVTAAVKARPDGQGDTPDRSEWGKILKLLGVEVIRGAPTAAVRVQPTI